MKYDVKITGLGSMAMEFLDPSMEMQFVILFNDDAPPELADMAILHTAGTLSEDPAPGDTLKIVDRKLYVKAKGESDFRLLDAKDAKGFERIYSETGAYHGYAHMPEPAIHLTSNSAEMQIPDGHYVMLGDNSETSKDSRYWGSVPRKNLVGKPGVVWWPLSRRWGLIDRLDPDPAIGPTPANYPVIP